MILRPADLAIPTAPEDLFGRRAPLVVEVGFGSGSFLEHLASVHPEWNVLGVEMSIGSVRRTYRRLQRAGLEHVRLFPGDARFIVRNVIPEKSLHRIYVNFPDPWAKRRYRDRRLLQTTFFELLSTRLGEAGSLLFTTDHAEYFEDAREQAAATGLYVIKQEDPPPATLQTKYARRWRDLDKSIHYTIFRKIAQSIHSFLPTIHTYPPGTMHHAILDGCLPPVSSFSKQVHPFDGGHVILLEAARPLNTTDRLLIFARIEEEELTQEVVIEARPHEKGVYVGIKSFCQPLTTHGTREAVRLVTEWLSGQGLKLIFKAY